MVETKPRRKIVKVPADFRDLIIKEVLRVLKLPYSPAAKKSTYTYRKARMEHKRNARNRADRKRK